MFEKVDVNVCNRNRHSANFSDGCEFSLKKTYTKHEQLQRCFLRIFAIDSGTNLTQNICLIEQPFFSKTLTFTMHLISNFICKDL